MPASVYNTHIIDNLLYLHGDAGAIALNAGLKTGATAGSMATQGEALAGNGNVTVVGGTAGTIGFESGVVADTQYRFAAQVNGAMVWGPGTGATDTTLSRNAAGILLADKNVFEGQAVTSGTVATTFTPDCKTGMLQRYNATSGGPGTLTIAAPLSPPDSTHTSFLVIRIGNTSGGTATLTWNGAFVAGATLALPASILNNANSQVLFVWNSANWQIQSIS